MGDGRAMPTKQTWLLQGLSCVLVLSAGCSDDDAHLDEHDHDDGGAGGSEAPADGGSERDGSAPAECSPRGSSELPAATGCPPENGDFEPCTDDDYPACISDDGEYHRIEASISTIGRVEAFEAIAGLLFDATRDPLPEDFLDARILYQTDEGLDSRVVRRFDPHYEVPEGTDCTLADVPAMFPDYCVGPAQLQPLLLDAFNAGAAGEAPRVQAARIEAGLLWFLYVSTSKESLTCTDVAKDCDSAYAYYTGGEDARGGIGLARYVRRYDPRAHDRAWNGLLAVRCWRDLDDAEIASDLELRDRARAQLDRALLDGLGAVARARLVELVQSEGDEAAAHVAFLNVLGAFLQRDAAERSESDAAVLATELAKTDAAEIDVDAALGALASLYLCP
jgi:hypothetical protein